MRRVVLVAYSLGNNEICDNCISRTHIDNVPVPRTNAHHDDVSPKGEWVTEARDNRVGGKSSVSLEEHNVAMKTRPVDNGYDTIVDVGLQRRVTNHALHEGKAELSGTARYHANRSGFGIGGRV